MRSPTTNIDSKNVTGVPSSTVQAQTISGATEPHTSPVTNSLNSNNTSSVQTHEPTVQVTSHTQGFDNNPFIQNPVQSSTFNPHTVHANVADEIQKVDEVKSEDQTKTSRFKKFNLKELIRFKKTDNDDDFGEVADLESQKKFNKEMFFKIMKNILIVLGIITIILSIIRVPYFGTFIDSVIFSFLFGWAKFIIYALVLTALVLLWFPKTYRKLFSKKKWLLYCLVILMCSIIMSSVGAYVMHMTELTSFKQYFIYENPLTRSEVSPHMSYITNWYNTMWEQDIVNYAGDYAQMINPGQYTYGGLFGIFLVAAFVYAAPAILIVLSIVGIVVCVTIVATKRRNSRKELSPLRKKLIQALGGFTKQQENSEIKTYDVSEMKFANSIHSKFDEMIGQNQKEVIVNPDVNLNVNTNDIPSINLETRKTESLVYDYVQVEEPTIIEVPEISPQTEMLMLEDEISPNKIEKVQNINEAKANKFDLSKKYESASQYLASLNELDYQEYPQITALENTTKDYWPKFKEDLVAFKNKLEKVFDNQEIAYDFVGEEAMFQSISVTYKFDSEDVVSEIMNHVEDIKQEIQVDKLIVQELDDYTIVFEIPTEERSSIAIKDVLTSIGYDHPLSVAVGKQANRKEYFIRAAYEPKNIVFGGKGSGRMVLLSSMIVSLVYLNSPKYLKGYIVDTNGKSLKQFVDLPHLTKPIINSSFDAISLLADINEQIDKQSEMFANKNVKNIYEYNNLVDESERIKNTFLVINDFNDLIDLNDEVFDQSIRRIIANAYNHGIFLLLSTGVVNPQTVQYNDLMDNVIALKVDSLEESKLILDKSGAEKLLGNGDMLLLTDKNVYRMQMPFANREETTNIINNIKEAFNR